MQLLNIKQNGFHQTVQEFHKTKDLCAILS